MDLAPEQIRWIFEGMIILILSIAIHEFGHAFVADRLGDPTPRYEGRVTLNPIVHADLIGTLILPLIGLVGSMHGMAGGGFGWGKPVNIRPERFGRRFSMATGHALVALAGPGMNVLLGILIAGIHVALLATGVLPGSTELNRVLWYAVGLNFTLFFFNLIPIPPLDGSKVMFAFLDRRTEYQIRPFLEQYGFFILLAVLFFPPGNSIGARIISPIINAIYSFLVGV
jgi:Zn-dependent protease